MFWIQSSIYEFFINADSNCLKVGIENLASLDIVKSQVNSNLTQSKDKDNNYTKLLAFWQKHSKDSKNTLDLNTLLKQCKPEPFNQKLRLPKILICSSEESFLANQALCAITALKHAKKQDLKENELPILLPDIRLSPFDSTQSFYEEFHELFAKLALWYENDCKQILISPPHTLMSFMPTKELLHSFYINRGDKIVVSDFISTLLHYGYEHVEIVEMQGEFSHRGDIIDIFIPSCEFPVRISLFDTEIEEINYFNHETQLSQNNSLQNLKIYPAMFSLNAEQHTYLESCIKNLHDNIEKNINAVGFWFLKEIGGINFLATYSHIFTPKALNEYIMNLEFVMPEVIPQDNYVFSILPDSINFKDIEPLKLTQLNSILKLNKHKKITILSTTNAMLKSYNLESSNYNFKENEECVAKSYNSLHEDSNLEVNREYDLESNRDFSNSKTAQSDKIIESNKDFLYISKTTEICKDDKNYKNDNMKSCHDSSVLGLVSNGNLNSLVKTTNIITPFYLNITSNNYLFLSLQKPQIKRKKRVKLELDTLKVGEFVVHNEYGIGIFEAIKQVSIMGGLKDFISIKYANDDKLLLPVENLNMIEKYSAYDSVIRLDKLGKSSFLKLKDSIKEKLFAIANEIIRLQAQRTLSKGVILSLDTPEQITAMSAFDAKRGFVLTDDQNLAIQESLKDLKSGMIMDRLLNGDVGFGKTEVAMTLCFASALNGYNSIVLVPTTLLCNQHFDSFKERLNNTKLPCGKTLCIAKIDRFTTPSQKKEMQENLKNNIQIIIGTHSIFNLDISNLGLMVIDEEHKFGVKQKELLKQKSLTTHILSMSATPIPRTLNMTYSKLKAISELKTPPFFKQEGKTFVKIKQDSLIKEVILRELRRGGQIFYIFNNIAKISTIKSYLLELLPNLRILILHSQINPKDTEKGMLSFLKKEYDLLLCTSIVESGIHLPNANTIIIDEAHNFGIADLHQLRGRVGRGRHIGFCYLLTKDNITEEAAKRLLSLEKNSYLGSGAALAYHDLEIRGGGNLLGEAQSGHIKQVGFGMYVRMLEDTLQNLLQNEQQEHKVDIKLSVSAFLNDSLITSERMRLDLYRRLSQVKSEFEVRQIEGEIEQRFGRLDVYSLQFLEIIIIKTLALKLGIKAISNTGYNISLMYHDNTRITLQSPTKDDDDILQTITTKLKELLKAKSA